MKDTYWIRNIIAGLLFLCAANAVMDWYFNQQENLTTNEEN